MYAIPHVRNIEVQKQAQFVSGESQVRQQLSTVNREHFFNTLDLNDQAVLDNEVHSVGGSELNPLVNDGKVQLVLKLQVGLRELVIETGVAGALQECRPRARCERASLRR